ncbi:MAG: hypothetical protein SOH99_14800 [Acidipropionibacterium acidipropionici]|jgi:hypothetical protein|nr:hypothetical protein [Acidipropionibacterium acidipropionici]APZ09681.1 hypothetical protein BWX38_10990 [Acidipropionibacterium acidipropionici]QCV96314.1 hypothetical protein FEZ30_14565 [Acidipropionibacterium acidipropionici]
MGAMHGWALTVDQRRSRMSEDLVPALQRVLAELPVLDDTGATPARPPRWDLPAERTAGDEVQAFTTDPGTLVAAVWAVCGQKLWWCGVGLGAVRTPLPGSTREAAGSAYIAARVAVEEAKKAINGVSVEVAEAPAPRLVQVLDVLAEVVGSLTSAELDVCDLYDRGMARPAIAGRLGISAPAVSKRLTTRRWEFLRRTRALAVDLAAEALSERTAQDQALSKRTVSKSTGRGD